MRFKFQNLKSLDADKKNAYPGQVRLILPTLVTIIMDIWGYNSTLWFKLYRYEFKWMFGFFNCLNQIKGFIFIEFNCDKPSNKS